jgi:hypothetical protein
LDFNYTKTLKNEDFKYDEDEDRSVVFCTVVSLFLQKAT